MMDFMMGVTFGREILIPSFYILDNNIQVEILS